MPGAGAVRGTESGAAAPELLETFPSDPPLARESARVWTGSDNDCLAARVRHAFPSCLGITRARRPLTARSPGTITSRVGRPVIWFGPDRIHWRSESNPISP